MKNGKTLSQLFLRECNAQQLVALADIDDQVVETEAYRSWLKGKRELKASDVENTHWIKTCTAGYVTEVIFHSDGALDEYKLFDRLHTKGSWELVDGVLEAQILTSKSTHTLAVVGNAEVNIHSAIEHENGELHAYLKLSQVK